MSAPLEGKPPSDEQRQLVTLFQELEKNQPEFLDEAGKRIIELTTALLGLLFAVTAFGKDFPPPYLAQHEWARWLAVIVLGLYLAAMFCGLWTVQPRDYKLFRHNLTGMREELDKMIANKSRNLRWAGIFFALGSLALVGLVAGLIIAK